ncbi:MAG: ferredoxin [Gemmatimonadetes bacterium]|nr:ferredoxin [Gemmatimonadota bacterium]NIR79884.1 ferredoxin [Gemmatimonadota bacterium]NIT88601.1 ferredoxin [Gemmatimonadota bacterium]NIU30613.1 ferredoxin [Gemmatimonadota bacterium]NIU36921.1 ferredoxin [Gemmatimonadota bacterium]
MRPEERLSDHEERRLGRLTVKIDRLLCVGFGDCIEAAPEAFEFDGEGIATLTNGANGLDEERLLEACDLCPVDALIVLDEDGSQLVP